MSHRESTTEVEVMIGKVISIEEKLLNLNKSDFISLTGYSEERQTEDFCKKMVQGFSEILTISNNLKKQ